MVQERYEIYCKALKEVSEIIKCFPESDKIKIPKSFLDFVEENKDNSYEYKVENIDNFQNENMMEETKIMLSIIYRDFIASGEEKEQMLKQKNKEVVKDSEESSSDNLLENEEIKKEEEEREEETKIEEKIDNTETQIALVEYKESIFRRIINWIKRTI